VTDHRLPDGDWTSILALAQGETPAAKVVVCSRLADEDLWLRALEAGAFDVLAEPYRPQEVQRVIVRAAVPATTCGPS
jgi:DNA-binding NtrC family response regulator